MSIMVMFMCCTKRSSVINSIYCGQLLFSYINNLWQDLFNYYFNV